MKNLRYIGLIIALSAVAGAAPLKDNIKVDALIVTKAELRRHMAAPEDDSLRPATYAGLEASRGAAQPDYLVVRFLATVPGHYSGEMEAKIDGGMNRFKLNVTLHFNKGWVEYFVPVDSLAWRSLEFDGKTPRRKDGGPAVSVEWNSLHSE